jgi:hypothetical protein
MASLMLLGSLWASACSQAPASAPAAPKASPKPEVALTASALTPDPKLSRLPLGTRLVVEAEARPARAVRPEQLFAAMQRQGILLSRKRQVLASTVGALYCELAVSDTGLGVSFCEYADDAAARAGAESSHRLFDAIVPGRTLISHGGSVLTLTHAQGPRAERAAHAIADTFSSLSPVKRER